RSDFAGVRYDHYNVDVIYRIVYGRARSATAQAIGGNAVRAIDPTGSAFAGCSGSGGNRNQRPIQTPTGTALGWVRIEDEPGRQAVVINIVAIGSRDIPVKVRVNDFVRSRCCAELPDNHGHVGAGQARQVAEIGYQRFNVPVRVIAEHQLQPLSSDQAVIADAQIDDGVGGSGIIA